MHSEGIMAGELKHGPLALVDVSMPVLMIVLRDPVYQKCMNALQQVQAREGRPILICEEGDVETISCASQALEIPKTVDCLQVKTIEKTRFEPNYSFILTTCLCVSYRFQGILTVIPMQLLSYHIAVMRGCNVDCPRNLAKSVTTE